MAEARKLLLNDLLCFTVSKFPRAALRPLKATIVDFFSSEDISAARECLLSEAEGLGIDNLVKLPRRRKDSVNRMTSEVDDILNLIASIDESKFLHRLPLFVSADPDKMPSIKLTEGDLSFVLAKLDKLDGSLGSITQLIGDTNRQLSRQIPIRQTSNVLQNAKSGSRPTAAGASSFTDTTVTNSSGIATGAPSDRNASESDRMVSEMDETSDDGAWNVATTKKRRVRSSPGAAGQPNFALAVKSTAPSANHPVKPARQSLKSLIGSCASSSIRAAKTLQLPKAVYRLGNIDSSYSAEDIQDHIRSLGVRVVTCFELPRSTRQPTDNKAFRVCIIAADKDKLFSSENWSVGVTLREWLHKPKKDDSSESRPGTLIGGMGISISGVATGGPTTVDQAKAVLPTSIINSSNVCGILAIS